ncbi:hypothetical protein [Testudinibacter sp. P27/CKL/0425]
MTATQTGFSHHTDGLERLTENMVIFAILPWLYRVDHILVASS